MATQTELLISYMELTAVYSEYQVEYMNAVEYAGLQIWASIYRRNGDPRWELAANSSGSYVEFCG